MSVPPPDYSPGDNIVCVQPVNGAPPGVWLPQVGEVYTCTAQQPLEPPCACCGAQVLTMIAEGPESADVGYCHPTFRKAPTVDLSSFFTAGAGAPKVLEPV